MDVHNSRQCIYTGLVCALYRDIAQCYGISNRTIAKEIEVIQARVAKEGLSFLTMTLPKLGKAVDTALAKPDTRFSIRSFRAKNGAVPKFIGWLLNRVFDTEGRELKDSDPVALKHIRQFVYFLYKLETPYADKTAQAVVDAFVQTEIDLANISEVDPDLNWIKQARDIVTRVVSPLDPARIKPRHGPGSVATGEDVLEKTNFKRIYSSLEAVYPFTEWMVYNLNHVADLGDVARERLEVIPTPSARVVLVPKDSRGPRLISCEPLEVQWIQQGLGRALQELIELSRWSRNHVNFTKQTTNRRLALEGSKGPHSRDAKRRRIMQDSRNWGPWVTLDMQEASDRVSLDLVEKLFQWHPRLLEALKATRSHSTVLPDGTVQPLKKFAPMGSALCFPVESLCFYALAVGAIIDKHQVDRFTASKLVYVYGDDLIVREKVYLSLIQLFPTVGLKFNEAKCCTAGFFRESCGCDAYKGVDVTPVRLRTVWSSSRRNGNPSELASYVALYNAMLGHAHYHVCDYIRTLVEDKYGLIPCTNSYTIADNGSYVSTAGYPAWVAHESCRIANAVAGFKKRYNNLLQRTEIFTYVSAPLKRKQRQDGYAELLRRTSDGFGSHGGVYALARRNRLKRAWMSEV